MRIIYLDIDSLRPDHLGCYGNPLPASPNIDALAGAGIRFSNCFASDSPCVPSRASLFLGRFGIETGVIDHDVARQTPKGITHAVRRSWGPQLSAPSLAAAFSAQGVPSTTISTFGRHPAPWFYEGWSEIIDPQFRGHFQHLRAYDVNNVALPWIEAHRGKSYFLHVQYWDPHAPYFASHAEAAPFLRKPPEFPTAESFASDLQAHAWHRPRMLSLGSREELAFLLAQYDAEIHCADRGAGALAARLKDLGDFEDTLIVVSADHGEEFGEKGAYQEHGSVYEGTAHLPLIFHWPRGIGSPGVAEGLAYGLDVGPTLLSLAGLEIPAGWHGKSLAPQIRNPRLGGRDELYLSHGMYCYQRAVRTLDWKFVKTFHPGLWKAPAEALFRISEDPWEQNDLAAAQPGQTDSLRATLTDWEDSFARRGWSDPFQKVQAPFGVTVDYVAESVKRLRETGMPERAYREVRPYPNSEPGTG